jgi:hypothetical protein
MAGIKDAALAGIGQTPFARQLPDDERTLACRAIVDAEIAPAEFDARSGADTCRHVEKLGADQRTLHACHRTDHQPSRLTQTATEQGKRQSGAGVPTTYEDAHDGGQCTTDATADTIEPGRRGRLRPLRTRQAPAGLLPLDQAMHVCRATSDSFVRIGLHEPTEDQLQTVARAFVLHTSVYIEPELLTATGEIMVFIGARFVVVRHGPARGLTGVRRALESRSELFAHGRRRPARHHRHCR